jgi:hypothetical protein
MSAPLIDLVRHPMLLRDTGFAGFGVMPRRLFRGVLTVAAGAARRHGRENS